MPTDTEKTAPVKTDPLRTAVKFLLDYVALDAGPGRLSSRAHNLKDEIDAFVAPDHEDTLG